MGTPRCSPPQLPINAQTAVICPDYMPATGFFCSWADSHAEASYLHEYCKSGQFRSCPVYLGRILNVNRPAA